MTPRVKLLAESLRVARDTVIVEYDALARGYDPLNRTNRSVQSIDEHLDKCTWQMRKRALTQVASGKYGTDGSSYPVYATSQHTLPEQPPRSLLGVLCGLRCRFSAVTSIADRQLGQQSETARRQTALCLPARKGNWT